VRLSQERQIERLVEANPQKLPCLCPACGEWIEAPARLCPNGCLRSDGKVLSPQLLARPKVYESERWRRLSRHVRRRDGCCVDCGSTDDLTADHIEGFANEHDPPPGTWRTS
jgi:5-methylcytosine-specific restriction endonuclease McrA